MARQTVNLSVVPGMTCTLLSFSVMSSGVTSGKKFQTLRGGRSPAFHTPNINLTVCVCVYVRTVFFLFFYSVHYVLSVCHYMLRVQLTRLIKRLLDLTSVLLRLGEGGSARAPRIPPPASAVLASVFGRSFVPVLRGIKFACRKEKME